MRQFRETDWVPKDDSFPMLIKFRRLTVSEGCLSSRLIVSEGWWDPKIDIFRRQMEFRRLIVSKGCPEFRRLIVSEGWLSFEGRQFPKAHWFLQIQTRCCQSVIVSFPFSLMLQLWLSIHLHKQVESEGIMFLISDILNKTHYVQRQWWNNAAAIIRSKANPHNAAFGESRAMRGHFVWNLFWCTLKIIQQIVSSIYSWIHWSLRMQSIV